MEGSGLSGRIFSNVGGGILGLEMPLHPPSSSSQTTNQNPTQIHPQIIPFNQPSLDQQTQLTMKQPNYPYPNPGPSPNPNPNPPVKNKTQMGQSPNSDEDEAGNEDGSYSYDGKRKSPSPWQRMKWTDNMVRLLIMAVYYIGDEAGNGMDHGLDKKKGSGTIGSSGSGVLQKKGKWKSVSRAMMEKGFYVSPQQCEDKFNDLNKRYKRVNDILGKGTACKVVENQSLLDTMDISLKLKDEARKLLNSKHLFFREMCAYHRSCGHDTTGHANALQVSQQQQQQQINNPQQQQQSCPHTSTSTTPIVPSSSMVPINPKPDDHDDDDENHDDDDDDEYDEDDEDDDDEHEENVPRKRARTNGGILSNTFQAWQQQLNNEITGILQDGSKSSWEKKNWVLTQLIQLEEKGVGFQYQAMEIERQRQKWIKFSSKKEREMEKMKLDNLKKRLENEKMVLFLKKKEMELLAIEQQQQRSCVSG